MKKILICAMILLGLTSCYNARVCVGDVNPETPMIKVNTVKNHHLLYGLIPVGNNKIKASKYIGNRKDYAVKNNWTFLDGFLGVITWGIYTPTTTTFYVPLYKEIGESNNIDHVDIDNNVAENL